MTEEFNKIALTEKSDEEILELSQRKPDVFSFIVDRYTTSFLRKAEYIVGDKNAAQDIVQDTFVKIYVHGKSFHKVPGATFKSWAYKILINTCFTWCKKEKRAKEFFVRVEDDEDLQNIGDASELVRAEKRLDIDYLSSLIGKLPEMLGRMMTLHFIEGKPQKDIAVMEGVSENVVRTRIHRAKKIMQNIKASQGNR